MALWQPLLVLVLIVGTVGVTYAVFRLRYPADPAARASEAAAGVAAGPPAAAPPDPDPQWTVSEVVGDQASAARRLREEPAEIVSVVLAHMSDGSVRVSRGAVPAPADGADRIVERIHTVTARNLMDAAWTPATSGWEISDPGWFDGTAGGIADADRALHAVLVGRTSAETAERFGLTADVAGGTGEFAAVLVPLPFDSRVASVVRAVRVVGLVFGVATGHPPLALACAKSLARTEITTRLRDALTTMTDPSRTRPITDRPATPDLTRPDTPIRATPTRDVAAQPAASRDAGPGDAEWMAQWSRSDDDDAWHTRRGASRADQDEWSSRSDPPSRDREGPWGGAPGPR
ncbi:MAG TPA: hypothetical protein VI357_14525 [Mycobacteriales bacterium]